MNFFRRLRRTAEWVYLLWCDADWDQSFLLIVIEAKLRFMAEYHLKHGHTVHAVRSASQMIEAAALCARMSREQYEPGRFTTMREDWKYPDGTFGWCLYEDYMYEQDLDRFCMLLKKYLRTWWD